MREFLKVYRGSKIIEICIKTPGCHVLANDSHGWSMEAKITPLEKRDPGGWDGEFIFFSDSPIQIETSTSPQVVLLTDEDLVEEKPKKKCRRL